MSASPAASFTGSAGFEGQQLILTMKSALLVPVRLRLEKLPAGNMSPAYFPHTYPRHMALGRKKAKQRRLLSAIRIRPHTYAVRFLRVSQPDWKSVLSSSKIYGRRSQTFRK
jgi:hypothetical protein